MTSVWVSSVATMSAGSSAGSGATTTSVVPYEEAPYEEAPYEREAQDGGRAGRVEPQVGGQRLRPGAPLQKPGQQGPGERQVLGEFPAAAHQVERGDPGGTQQRLARAFGQWRRALLYPDGAQLPVPGPDGHREPAADPQLGVAVDADHLVAGAQVMEHAPLAQLRQVRLRSLPAEDGASPQVVDLVGVGGAGVRQHPVGGVLDADDAAGEDGGGLGEREQVALLGPLPEVARCRVVKGGAGQRVHLFPACFAAQGEQGDFGLGGSLAEGRRLFGTVQSDHDGGGPIAPGGPQRGMSGPATGTDDEDQLARPSGRRVLGVEQGDAADLDVQSGGSGLHLHQRITQGHQQLAQADARCGRRYRGRRYRGRRYCGRIHGRRLCCRLCWGATPER